jgi:curved DNA-binding protein CbpA
LKQTHYHTLGLHPFASLEEVKQAYRRLAKRYHPDVNPNGKEEFAKIAAAYEVIGDSSKKYIYDSRLKRGLLHEQNTQSHHRHKNKDSQDLEIKRRQYYQQHYKKHYEQQQAKHKQTTTKSNYNEYKYILFATPLAVVLVLLMLNLFHQDAEEKVATNSSLSDTLSLNNGVAPYAGYFPEAIFIKEKSRQLLVLNETSKDAVCLIFSKKKYLRQFYLKKKNSATIAQLPNDSLEVRYLEGLGWSANQEVFEDGTQKYLGTFKFRSAFYKQFIPPTPSGIIHQVTLQITADTITKKQFFSKK